MAKKRYDSGMIKQPQNDHCNLPDQVIRKKIPKEDVFPQYYDDSVEGVRNSYNKVIKQIKK